MNTRADNQLPQAFWIAEYSALKQEQVARITLRETALYMSLALNISAIAAYFTEVGSKYPIPLIVPLISFTMFFIYAFNDGMVTRIRQYLVDELRPRIKATAVTGNTETHVFGWETYHRRRSLAHYSRKFFRLIVVWLAFSGLTIASLWLTVAVGQAVFATDFYWSNPNGVIAVCWWAGIISAIVPYIFGAHLLDL